ncbi:DUF4344 domain-containing metallopeptidase [Marinibaculum pumilum]|uniref:DUF4344 domain-containing metallopeptidase n=1 Tax=Marinibaculum pumilum TaxID=1766165 RepID=A0ABV7L259_9PROT
MPEDRRGLPRTGRLLRLLALVLALLPTAVAGGAWGADDPELTEEEAEDLVLFVNGNTLFTLYHELGHALVHRLEIPVLGREEDAVDSLAGWLMVPEEPDAEAEELLMAAGDGHALAAYYGEDDELAFWDEHSMDLQRFAAIYCLLYGSDPEGFAELADDIEMPDGDRERCPATYAQVEASWLSVLAPHLRDGPGDRPGGGRIVVRFEVPGAELDPALKDLVEVPGLMQAAADDLSAQLVLPGDIPVLFKTCGEENAFYDPETGQVEMCYELIAWFVDLYLQDLEEMRAEAVD